MVSLPLAAVLLLTASVSVQAVAAASAGQYALPAQSSPPLATSLRHVVELLESATATSIQARSAKPRAIAAANTLLAVSAKVSLQASTAYRAHLAKAVRLLERAITSDDKAYLDRTIQAFADDLEIKVEHSRMSGGRLGGSVTVHVRALRGAEELTDIEVFCLLAVHEAGGMPPDRFPAASGTSKMSLVPGRYLVWARDPLTDATGDPMPLKVGEGRRELHLDLLAPTPRGR